MNEILPPNIPTFDELNAGLRENTLSHGEVYEKLSRDFSAEALQTYKKKGPTLTTIKAGYIVQRMNQTFGVNGWAFGHSAIVKVEDEIVTTTYVWVAIEGKIHKVSGSGTASWKNMGGDAIKSAVTDGMTKAVSYLGCGESVFLGKVGSAEIGKLKRKEQRNAAPLAPKNAPKVTNETVGAIAEAYQSWNPSKDEQDRMLQWMSDSMGTENMTELTELDGKRLLELIQRKIATVNPEVSP
jgi:hypothetical protein